MLYVNGDSWSFHHVEYNFPVWPDLVAKHFNLEINNTSLGCGSNSRIVDCLASEVFSGKKFDLLLFGLTSHHRYHLPSSDLGSWVIGPLTALNEHTGQVNQQFVDLYFKHCYSEIDSVYRYYRDLWFIDKLSRTLESKYIMIQMWESCFTELKLLNDYKNIENYVSQFYEIDSYIASEYIKKFDTLRKFSVQWNYVEEPASLLLTEEDYLKDGHPNSYGHKKIANYIIELVEDYK
jgi:hypothetical protein